ncbi:MAG: hypothetical protein AAB296_09430, partial [Candidatus Desantisbacteria bacterium]
MIGNLAVPADEKWQDMRQVPHVEFSSSPLLITKVRFEIQAKRLDISPPSEVQIEAKGQQVVLCWQPDDNP